MTVKVRFDPTLNSPQMQVIPDASPTTDGVMTKEQAAALASFTPGGIVWTAITAFLNGWQNTGAPYYNAAYTIDGQGFVHLRGSIKNGSVNLPAFALPAGFRPGATVQLPPAPVTTGDVSDIAVAANGNVTVETDPAVPSPGPITHVSLDGVVFFAD
jgi:hypothetical protein